MKGFVHMIEVAISAMLIVLAFATFVTLHKAGLSWERPDLIALGENIVDNLEASGNLSMLLSSTLPFEEIERLKPANVRYGIRIAGAPAKSMKVGCNCTDAGLEWARKMLTPGYVNGRWANFTVEKAGPEDYDKYESLLFVNFTDFDKQEWGGRKITAVADVADMAELDSTFALSQASNSGRTVAFEEYQRYWSGFGLEALATGTSGGKPSGAWTLWESGRNFNISGGSVEIEGVGKRGKGELFSLAGPDGKTYWFKVKDVLGDRAFMQPLNYSFKFLNFADDYADGSCIVGNDTQGFCAAARNGGRAWISYFPYSSEYQALLKALVAGEGEWTLLPAEESGVEVPAFVSTYMDVPETFQVTFILWYAY